MRVISIGHLLYALGIFGLGILGLIFDDYAMAWQPVPLSFPAHNFLAYVSALLLLVSGAGLLVRRLQIWSASILTGFILLWLVALRIPPLMTNFFNAGIWLGIGETLELTTGGWILTAALCRLNLGIGSQWITSSLSLRMGTLLFGISLPLIGLSHFVYASETAQMIPAWFPARIGFAYLTGAGHIAAGIGILLNILPRLAATLEACMMMCFVMIIHIPGVMLEPSSRLQWTMLCVAITITGAAAIFSHQLSYRRWVMEPDLILKPVFNSISQTET